MTLRTTVNVAIVLALAAIVAAVPGGGSAASVVSQAVYLCFLAALAWFASVMYRQHRYTLYSLSDRRRAALYVAVGVAVLTLTATHRLWSSSAGSVAWLVLLGAAIYTVAAVFVAARRG
jgi:hypothetical protein